jgi:hypothetical protein
LPVSGDGGTVFEPTTIDHTIVSVPIVGSSTPVAIYMGGRSASRRWRGCSSSGSHVDDSMSADQWAAEVREASLEVCVLGRS